MVRDKAYDNVRAMLGEIILGYLAFLAENEPDTLDINEDFQALLVAGSNDARAVVNRLCGYGDGTFSDG